MKHDEVEVVLLVSDAHGIYIPKIFSETFANVCDEHGNELTGETLVDMSLIKNPDNEMYWEAWENVLNSVHVFKEVNNGMDNEIFTLYQNGDLWAIKKDDLDSLTEEESELFWENYTA